MNITSHILVEDHAYRTLPSGELLARLYRPIGEGPYPAVVSVHGGRWVSQSRLTNEVIDRRLADAGVVVMAIDFRMPPLAQYPEPVADINFAMRWLKQSARRLGSDPSLVGSIGTSSGGHQTMLNALRPNDPRYASIPLPGGAEWDAAAAYAVACWPVLDPLARYRMAKQKKMDVHIQSHHAYWLDEVSMGEGNPQLILERGEQEAMPPLLLVQGTGDNIVPAEMTELFAATYQEKGGTAQLETFAGKPHTFITSEPDSADSQAAIGSIIAFVSSQAQRIARR